MWVIYVAFAAMWNFILLALTLVSYFRHGTIAPASGPVDLLDGFLLILFTLLINCVLVVHVIYLESEVSRLDHYEYNDW